MPVGVEDLPIIPSIPSPAVLCQHSMTCSANKENKEEAEADSIKEKIGGQQLQNQGGFEKSAGIGIGTPLPPPPPSLLGTTSPPAAAGMVQMQNTPKPNDGGIRAKAIWDYQAEVVEMRGRLFAGLTNNVQDSTELSFNPDEVITDIQMVHQGWWYGRAPTGLMGLFPSNYVQIL
jgi:hypothetical protein